MPRVVFTSRIHPSHIAEYKRRHAQVWPQMLQALKETGWENYTIHLSDDGLLVGVVDVDDYAAAVERMSHHEVNALWQAQMAEFFTEAENPDEDMQILPKIFDLDAQWEAAQSQKR